MTDFSDLIGQAKKMQEKMKETQENLKKIEVEGISGGDGVKIIMNGDGDLKKITFNQTLYNEPKEIGKKTFYETQNIIKKKMLSEEKKGQVYKNIKNVFSDAELLEVKKKD